MTGDAKRIRLERPRWEGGEFRIEIGDIVRLKKKHPCGSIDWRVSGAGAVVNLVCLGCGRETEAGRTKLARQIRYFLRQELEGG